MKELLLHATLAEPHQQPTPREVCQQLARFIAKQQPPLGNKIVSEVLPPLLFHVEKEELCVWIKDPSPHPDTQLLRYRRIGFRPIPLEAEGQWKIALSLPPPLLVYIAAPMSTLTDLNKAPQLVVNKQEVMRYSELSLQQMKQLHHIYAVIQADTARSLGCTVTKEHPLKRPNHYALLQQRVEEMLAGCFPLGFKEEGGLLDISPTLLDVPPSRIQHIDAQHRQLLFNESQRGDDPLLDFPLYGAFTIPPYRHTRLVMLYPQGELKAAQTLFNELSLLRELIGLHLMKDEHTWIAYQLNNDLLRNIFQDLYTLKTNSGTTNDLLLCYISPQGTDAKQAKEMHLAAHIRRLCALHQWRFVCPVPLSAIRRSETKRLITGMASQLLADMKCLPWVLNQFTTHHTDLIVGLSALPAQPGMDSFCGATFYFNQKSYYGYCKAVERALLVSQFSLLLQQAIQQFRNDHNECLPQRIVVYCHRGIELQLCKSLGNALKNPQIEIPIVLAFVKLTTSTHPTYYHPQSACLMPEDGTCIRQTDGSYLLFCNDYRPNSGKEPSRYPFPLEVNLQRLMPDGQFRPLDAEEARPLLIQAYQLTCIVPSRLDRCTLPVIVVDANRLVRRQHAENEASASFSQRQHPMQ